MEQFKRILVPLNGSESAEGVSPKVEELATELKASITLLIQRLRMASNIQMNTLK